MLRAEKKITIQGQDITVREITPDLAETLYRAVLDQVEGRDIATMADVVRLVVGNTEQRMRIVEECTDLEAPRERLGASAFMELWDAIEEVNAPFFEVMNKRFQTAAGAGKAKGKEGGTSYETSSEE